MGRDSPQATQDQCHVRAEDPFERMHLVDRWVVQEAIAEWLEDAEDILEAGIEVIARPPGKETRSISLLSGGEKSMTALALLFSVFKAKPSPFCFLDEVDAALDEANNERFNMLVQEFQKDSQFVIITHAKRTMSIADVLFGITMQIRGVSKKISVRFDEYDEEPAAVA